MRNNKFCFFILELDIGTDVVVDMKDGQTFLKPARNEK